MDPPPTRIVIELTPDAVPIAGRVHVCFEEPQPFTGWTGLFAALRAAAGGDAQLPDERPGPGARLS